MVIPHAASDSFHPIPEVEPVDQVLFVGSRSGYKNFRSVVDALSSLHDLRLVCVGGGPLSPDEVRLLEKLLPGRYNWSGYLSSEELNLEYNKSACQVYPSVYEGFGIPVLEAMQAGCPVVAVKSSSMPEVAGDAALLTENGDADEICDAIKLHYGHCREGRSCTTRPCARR